MKLISMTEKVLQLSKDLGIGGDTFHDFYLKTTYYANFLSQPLTLGMFVPCVDNVPLEEPKSENYLTWFEYEQAHKQYQQAKENILFEGFYLLFESSDIICVDNDTYQLWFYKDGRVTINSKTIETLEDLVKYKLTLTKTAKQQLK